MDLRVGCPGEQGHGQCGHLVSLNAEWCPGCERTFPDGFLRHIYERAMTIAEDRELTSAATLHMP